MATTKSFSGKRLRELRERAGVSRMALAYACSRTEQSVYVWERGRSRPRPDLLDPIASMLGVTRDDLFEDQAERANV